MPHIGSNTASEVQEFSACIKKCEQLRLQKLFGYTICVGCRRLHCRCLTLYTYCMHAAQRSLII